MNKYRYKRPPLATTVIHWLVLMGTAGLVLLIDQVTKLLVTEELALGQTWTPIPALADVFAITRSANTGAALGILPQAGDIFLVIALVMMMAIIVFYHRMPPGHWLERIGLGLLLGGAAGNAVDRLRLGYVVDFVHLQFRPFISNVSNLADHAIVIGILILFLVQWTTGPNRKPAPPVEPVETDKFT